MRLQFHTKSSKLALEFFDGLRNPLFLHLVFNWTARETITNTIITARVRSTREGNALTRVCPSINLSVHRGGYPYPIMLCNISQNAMRQRRGGTRTPPGGTWVRYPPGGVPGSGTPRGGYPGQVPPGGYPGQVPPLPPRGGYPGQVPPPPGGYPGQVPPSPRGGYPGQVPPSPRGGYPGQVPPGGVPGSGTPGGYPG